MFNNDFNLLENYIQEHCEPESELLKELSRQTYLKILRPRMLAGHVQGRVLAMISKMISPRTILEIGTFTGYSAICLAEGLQPGGKLITYDINDEIETFTRGFLERAPRAGQIEYQVKDAREALNVNKVKFDLVFIDGDKRQYPDYYEMAMPSVNHGGFIIVDNVLWSGKVIEYAADEDPYTRGVMKLNQIVRDDFRVENVIFPFRDGLLVIRKV